MTCGSRFGGKGADQAVQAAKLGVPTYMVGCVGEDAQGVYLLQAASTYGVNINYVKRLALQSCPPAMARWTASSAV